MSIAHVHLFLLLSTSSDTARQLLERGGERYLEALVCPAPLLARAPDGHASASGATPSDSEAEAEALFGSYQAAHSKLLELSGVGPKVPPLARL